MRNARGMRTARALINGIDRCFLIIKSLIITEINASFMLRLQAAHLSQSICREVSISVSLESTDRQADWSSLLAWPVLLTSVPGPPCLFRRSDYYQSKAASNCCWPSKAHQSWNARRRCNYKLVASSPVQCQSPGWLIGHWNDAKFHRVCNNGPLRPRMSSTATHGRTYQLTCN